MSETQVDNGSDTIPNDDQVVSAENLTEEAQEESLEAVLWKIKEEELINQIVKYKTDLNKEIIKVSTLEKQLQERTQERDNLRNETQKLERALTKNSLKHGKNKDKNTNDIVTQAKSVIFEKTKVCKNQELQIDALKEQVKSLKEIVTISKDMLDIRNLEVKQLQEKLNCMGLKFTAEKDRHNLMNKKLDRMIEINADLKAEYDRQLLTFSALQKAYDLQKQNNAANESKEKDDDTVQ